RTGPVGRATQHLGQYLGKCGDGELRSLATGDGLGLFSGSLHELARLLGKVSGKFPCHATRQFSCFRRIGLAVCIERSLPFLLPKLALDASVPALIHMVRNDEGLVRPIKCFACSNDFVGAKRRTMDFFAAGHGGRTLADDGATAYKRGALAGLSPGLGLDDGLVNIGNIVAIDITHHVPAVTFETTGGIVTKPMFDLAVN